MEFDSLVLDFLLDYNHLHKEAFFAIHTVVGTSLDKHARLQLDFVILRAQAEKEKQLNHRVELNLDIKRLEADLSSVKETINPEVP